MLIVNTFYAGVLLTLAVNTTKFIIDPTSISTLPSERLSNQIAADVTFHVVQGRRSSS